MFTKHQDLHHWRRSSALIPPPESHYERTQSKNNPRRGPNWTCVISFDSLKQQGRPICYPAVVVKKISNFPIRSHIPKTPSSNAGPLWRRYSRQSVLDILATTVSTQIEEKHARTSQLPLLVRRFAYSFLFGSTLGRVCGVPPPPR